MAQYEDNRSWRRKYRPYLVAAALAMVTTMLVAPEMVEGDAMEPALSDGQVLVMSKTSYSAKRGAPEKGQVVVMEKWVGEDVYDDNIIGRVAGLPGEKVTLEDGRVISLTKDEIYLLSDNPDSEAMPDSRTIGPVQMKDIRGDAKWIAWPLSNIGGIK